MEKQYCKVGTVTPMEANTDIISLLEYQYQMFLDKASNMQTNTQIKKTLEDLV